MSAAAPPAGIDEALLGMAPVEDAAPVVWGDPPAIGESLLLGDDVGGAAGCSCANAEAPPSKAKARAAEIIRFIRDVLLRDTLRPERRRTLQPTERLGCSALQRL